MIANIHDPQRPSTTWNGLGRGMYPAAFDYLAPATWDEVIAALVEHGTDAKVLAGGCSLIPLLKLRLAEPHVLIDLRRVGAREVIEEPDRLRLGAMVRE